MALRTTFSTARRRSSGSPASVRRAESCTTSRQPAAARLGLELAGVRHVAKHVAHLHDFRPAARRVALGARDLEQRADELGETVHFVLQAIGSRVAIGSGASQLDRDVEARERHQSAVLEAARHVIEPTLVVWLDAPPAELAARVHSRGRSFETPIGEEFLSRLRAAYAQMLDGPFAPPLYRPQSSILQELTDELLLVAQAISG